MPLFFSLLQSSASDFNYLYKIFNICYIIHTLNQYYSVQPHLPNHEL
jgi:hypothetical protein